ncbi:unnamed protein product, partial [Rotaria socialis]
PGQHQIPRAPFLSMNAIKRKASQPIKLQVIDTTMLPGAKRRPPIDAFKRSRSFTNVEHTETQLGMDYIEEDEDNLIWKPFGPKKSVSQITRKDASSVPHLLPPPITIFECQVKRTVRFPPSVHDPIEVIELDLDETTADEFSQAIDRNNNNANKRKIDIVSSIINIEED